MVTSDITINIDRSPDDSYVVSILDSTGSIIYLETVENFTQVAAILQEFMKGRQ